MLKICPICNNVFEAKGRKQICCSVKCAGLRRRKGKTSMYCQLCGKYFEYNADNAPNRKYCSWECYRKVQFRHERVCKHCGKKYVIAKKYCNRHYCSRKCYNEHRAAERITVSCRNCGKSLTRSIHFIYNPDMTFCSNTCRWEYTRGKNHHGWIHGEGNAPYHPNFNDAFKRKIRERDGNRCILCQCTPEQNRQALSLHHIHYDKANDCSNLLDFILLCNSCNMRVNANRDFWTVYFETLVTIKYGNLPALPSPQYGLHLLLPPPAASHHPALVGWSTKCSGSKMGPPT